MTSQANDAAHAYNRHVADMLTETATVLAAQNGNPFRVNAYRRAAQTVLELREDIRELYEREGHEGLLDLPFIGRGLAATIEEIIRTGHYARLDRLRGETNPEALFRCVPGIGPVILRRIRKQLRF